MTAFPAHSRTYYTSVDYDLGAPTSATDRCRRFLWGLKAAMKKEILTSGRSAVTAWTCTGSGDSSTAGIDGVDRWGSTYNASKIVVAAAASPHSWIVLRNATIGVWLILDATSATNPAFYICTSAPAGGSTTARPTAGTEVQIPAAGFSAIGGTTEDRCHIVSTSDGHFIWINGPRAQSAIEDAVGVWPLTDTKAGDPTPWMAFQTAEAFGQDGTLNAGQWRSGTIVVRNFANTAWLTCVPAYWMGMSNVSTWIYSSFGTGDGRNYQGEFEFGDLFIVSKTSPTIKGKMLDCFQGFAGRHGTLVPLDSSPPKYMNVNMLWFPFTDVPAL